MLGYTKTEYTEESFDSQGFFHTGDLGFISSEGYITVTGRKKDLIIRGGENISPKEVEDFLHEHPSVHEAAVVAMPHARLGEAPCAYVVLRQGASFDMDAMVFFLEQARLARQKFPERLFLVESLPRTPSGKVLKHVLRERVRRSVEEGK
jgi:acyl-CoA synthetase (AMP-forming)/AMP-acid ligase II